MTITDKEILLDEDKLKEFIMKERKWSLTTIKNVINNIKLLKKQKMLNCDKKSFDDWVYCEPSSSYRYQLRLAYRVYHNYLKQKEDVNVRR